MGYSEDTLRNMEAGQYGSQETTLEGTPSSGSETAVPSANAQTGEITDNHCSALEPFPEFDNSGFDDENGQVWVPLQILKPGGSIAEDWRGESRYAMNRY